MTTNPYVITPYALHIMQVIDQCESEAHKSNPSQAKSFSCTIYGRRFSDDYQEALAEFLNGM